MFPHLNKKKIYQNLRDSSSEVETMVQWAEGQATAKWIEKQKALGKEVVASDMDKDDLRKAWMNELDEYRMEPELWEDMKTLGYLHAMPSSMEDVAGLLRSYTALFKAGVLTSPDRYGRDLISGQIASALAGVFSFEAGFRAKSILFGEADAALSQPKGLDPFSDLLREAAEGMGLQAEALRHFNHGDTVMLKGDGMDDAAKASRKMEVIESVHDNGLIKLEGRSDLVSRDGYQVIAKLDDWFTPQIAVGVARWQYGAFKGSDASYLRDPNLNAAGELVEESSQVQQMYGGLPGTSRATDTASGYREVGRDFIKAIREGSWRPWDVEGVGQYWNPPEGVKRGTPRSRSTPGFREQKVVAAGNLVGKNFDDLNRLVPWIEGIRNGKFDNLRDSFDNATRIQLDYRPKTFGPIEKIALKKIFPFYSFFSREAVFLANELLTHPSGRLGKAIRASHHATMSGDEQGEEGYVPEYYREQMAIPLGESADGGRNYITGLGLMHEDPLSAIVGGLANPSGQGVRDVFSRMNPLIKAPIEHALGVSSFQGGPMGGRRLDQMDPTIGRLMSNLRNIGTPQDELPGGRADPFISQAFEHYAANSPASRVLNTLKKATDTRKSILQKIPDLVSGVKITTVSPESSRFGVREILNKAAKDLGAPMFTKYYLSKARRAEAAETDPETGEKMEIISEILRRMDKEHREENKREKASRLERVAQP
jgi:hypothetical protein